MKNEVVVFDGVAGERGALRLVHLCDAGREGSDSEGCVQAHGLQGLRRTRAALTPGLPEECEATLAVAALWRMSLLRLSVTAIDCNGL